MTELNGNGTGTRRVSIGIDAAVVAAHQVAIRGEGVNQDFKVPLLWRGWRRRPSDRSVSRAVCDQRLGRALLSSSGFEPIDGRPD